MRRAFSLSSLAIGVHGKPGAEFIVNGHAVLAEDAVLLAEVFLEGVVVFIGWLVIVGERRQICRGIAQADDSDFAGVKEVGFRGGDGWCKEADAAEKR